MKRHNSFDLMRHIAAYGVLISHHFALSGLDEPEILGMTTLGGFCVIIFFAISGYLITGSCINSTTYKGFMMRRIKRIMPALIVCSFLMIFVICSLYGKYGITPWLFSTNSVYAFISYSALQIDTPFINGFGNSYIYHGALNGSLWTLKFEFLAYITISILFFFRKIRITIPLVILLASIVTFKLTSSMEAKPYYMYRASMTLIPFTIGSLFYLINIQGLTLSKKICIAVFSFILLIISSIKGETSIFILTSSVLIILAGVSLKDNIINGRFDISYGVYIYAFPAQQVIINELTNNFALSLVIALVVTTSLGISSWILIEKRFISKRNHLFINSSDHIASVKCDVTTEGSS